MLDDEFLRDFFKMPPRKDAPQPPAPVMGCVCPPTSERTCQAPLCPRKQRPDASCVPTPAPTVKDPNP